MEKNWLKEWYSKQEQLTRLETWYKTNESTPKDKPTKLR